MKEGIAEYFLVSTQGKVHESVLRTEVDPYQIHVAMLLLGGKGAQTNLFQPDKPPPGDPITVEVSWKGLLSTKRVAAEELAMSRALNRQGRFIVLRETVTTSGRKLRTHSPWEILRTLSRLALSGRKGLRQREGLEIWYGARRDDSDKRE